MNILILVSLAFSTAVAVYNIFLAIVAVTLRRVPVIPEGETVHRFAIVIPAHNEESTLPGVLRSCRELDYPRELVEVIVVADNCTDGTQRVAEAHGALCLPRDDQVHRGKGHALDWALEAILPRKPDAVIILDADCILEPGSLQAFGHYLRRGALVLQANYVASNPDAGPISYMAAVGNAIENELFYAPKSALGSAVLLRGTGMVFCRSVLERIPWRSHSVAEDTEYSIQLARAGIPVSFVREAHVNSAFPATMEQLEIQRARWAGGNLGLAKSDALKLIAQGARRRRWNLVDVGWTMLVLSRPLILVQLLGTTAAAAIHAWIHPGPLTTTLLLACLALIAAQALYFLAGILRLGVTRRRLGLLLRSPLALTRLVVITMQGLFRKPQTWVRTPRE